MECLPAFLESGGQLLPEVKGLWDAAGSVFRLTELLVESNVGNADDHDGNAVQRLLAMLKGWQAEQPSSLMISFETWVQESVV